MGWTRGGDTVGNGGVIWACRADAGGQKFYSGLLTDLFEAKEQYGLSIIESSETDPLKLYELRKQWLQVELPDLYSALKPRFEYVEQHRSMVNAELLSTRDFNNAIKPLSSLCPQGQWQPLNIANFREEDQKILISSDLWHSQNLPTIDKAALLFHEAVYFWMRTHYGSTDSDKSRKITGLLFSTLPTNQIKKEIANVLGGYPDRPDGKYLCIIKNTRRNQIYVSYEADPVEGSLAVRTRCQDDPDANWCQRSSVECDEIWDSQPFKCVAENGVSSKIFTGKGRNLLEAKFNAHVSCFVGSQAQGVSTQFCPDFQFMECL